MKNKLMRKMFLTIVALTLFASVYQPVQAEASFSITSLDAMKNQQLFAGGYFSSIGVKSDKTLWGWGGNEKGQIGSGGSTTKPRLIPTGGVDVVAVSMNRSLYSTSMFVNRDGMVGQNGYGITGSGVSNAVAISVGEGHAMVLKNDGTVWAWGSSGWGTMGNGWGGNGQSQSVTTPVQASGLNDVIQISAGNTSSFALRSDGTLWGWGNWDYSNTIPSQTVPKQIMTDVSYITSGDRFSLAVKKDGSVWAWGRNDKGQLGDGTTTYNLTPVQVKGVDGSGYLTNIVAVAAGSSNSYALSADGKVYSWGYAFGGQLGNGNSTSYNQTTPILVTGIADVVGINAGASHALALKADGTLWGWGSNTYGEMGNGISGKKSLVPTLVGNGMILDPSVPNPTDTTPPHPATFTASPTLPTNSQVTVTIYYDSDSVLKEYKIGSNGAWTTYSKPVVVTSNTTIYARSKDAAGNQSLESSYEVKNIDRIPPTEPLVQVNGNQLTIISGTDASGIRNTEYQLNGGEWINYTGVVTLKDGSYVISARSIDNAGNISSLTTINVDVSSVALEDAIRAVEEAEASPSQDKVDKAQELINKLVNRPEKDGLQERLDKVQADLNLYASIQKEITGMDNRLNQGNVSKSLVHQYKSRVLELYSLIDSLPNTMDKLHLTKQLDELMSKLILIETVLNTNSGEEIEDVDLGELEDEVGKLPDGDLKDQLENELEKAKDFQDAIDKVEKAEKSKSQIDVDIAREAVRNLPDGNIKDELNKRLDEVQKQIDLAKLISEATKKVEQAEASKTQGDVNTAREVVSRLPDSQVKDELNRRLDAIQKQIDDANANPIELAVKKAEKTKLQVDVDYARDLVNTLPEGDEKNRYHERLDVVDAALKAASQKVRQAELYQRNPYLEDAHNLVNALKDSPSKKTLIERLNAVQEAIEDKENEDLLARATQKVKQAEMYKRNPYIEDAWKLVNQLRESKEKQALVERLKALEDEIAPKPPEPSKPSDSVKEKIEKIQDLYVKNDFMNFLFALESAEKYKTRSQILNAIEKANRISEEIRNDSRYSSIFNELNARLQKTKDNYNAGLETPKDADVSNARKYVELYEKYQSDFYKNKALDAVNSLPNSLIKDELQARINAVA
ncbi:protease epr (plasmid) [Paenibacillus thiaminolyticus]|uniref:RCC1 domain-containing protein n=1 Tax=Paenibacillus thiaminolyticus TaxID=49283 RepID=UPI00232FD1E4|nr:protease epr [Paenibacillus thiaminolyticus]WCF11447.1 protease epr [Paenibacillus thiaminolyticus]